MPDRISRATALAKAAATLLRSGLAVGTLGTLGAGAGYWSGRTAPRGDASAGLMPWVLGIALITIGAALAFAGLACLAGARRLRGRGGA